MSQPKLPKKEALRPCPPTDFVSTETKKEVVIKENPYEEILAREIRNWFDHSKMVGIVHVNPISGEDSFKAAVAFHKAGMHYKKYGPSLFVRALKGTNYETILPLNENKSFSTGFIFSTEHNNVSQMLKILKKVPQMNLLCGITEGRLLSKKEFEDYSKLPDIQIVRSQLTNVLNMAGQQLVQHLQSHQSNLVNILDAHVRENSKEKTEKTVAVDVKKDESQ
jgi:large subunit ribosomal protein L10